MNLVLLCKIHNHAKVIDILAAFNEEGLRMHGIVALAAPRSAFSFHHAVRKIYERLTRHTKGSAENSPAAELSSLALNGKGALTTIMNGQEPEVHGKPLLTLKAYARQYQIPVNVVKNLNSSKCTKALQDFQTEVLVLGGVPIMREQVLAIPQRGTLNVHMGWLPEMRGMNVAEWSILLHRPVAVSVHLVDTGVDTGAILHREKFETGHCRSLAEMRKQLSAFQHRVLARATRLFLEQSLHTMPQKSEDGKQYYTMHPRLRALVEKKLCAQHGNPA